MQTAAPTETTTKTPPPKPRDVSASASLMGLAEHRRQDWVLDVPEDHTPDDLLKASYWAHVAQGLEQYARIEARAETGEWVAELIVVQAGRNWATVKLLALHDLIPQANAKDAPEREVRHAVAWKGAIKKFCVVRLSDKAIISEGHANRPTADAALAQYENMIATS